MRVDGREPALIEPYLHGLQAAQPIGARGSCGVGDAASALIGLNPAHCASEAAVTTGVFRALPDRLMPGLESERYAPPPSSQLFG